MKRLLILILLIPLLVSCVGDPLDKAFYSSENITTTANMGASTFIGNTANISHIIANTGNITTITGTSANLTGNITTHTGNMTDLGVTAGRFTSIYATTIGTPTDNVTDIYVKNLHADNLTTANITGDVTGLPGLLADPQTPLAHATSHEYGGSDEVSLYELAKEPVTFYATGGGWLHTESSMTVSQYPAALLLLTGGTEVCNGRVYTFPSSLSATDQYVNFTSSFKYAFKVNCLHNTSKAEYQMSWYDIRNTSGTLTADNMTASGLGIRVGYRNATYPRCLYITSHDGATYSEVTTDYTFGYNSVTNVEIIYTAGSNIKVYVEGVLVGTKTTNLPSNNAGSALFFAYERIAGGGTGSYLGDRFYSIRTEGNY